MHHTDRLWILHDIIVTLVMILSITAIAGLGALAYKPLAAALGPIPGLIAGLGGAGLVIAPLAWLAVTRLTDAAAAHQTRSEEVRHRAEQTEKRGHVANIKRHGNLLDLVPGH